MQLNFKNKQIVIVAVLAVIFFIVYSFLIFNNPTSRFSWPDETANHFFIQNYIEHSNFSVAEPLNQLADNLIKPRSFNVYQGNLVPGSFLGFLLIYGLIGKIIGLGLINFFTPFLAAIAGLFFYKIVEKIFSPRIAFLSTLLFYLNPAWWYYASFSYLPNIAFLTFLLIGLYFLILIDKNKAINNYLLVILSSLFIGLALIIRTNEFLWIMAMLIFIVLVYFARFRWQYLLIGCLVIITVFLPIFYYNHITYGNFLSFGYLRLEGGDNLADQLPTEFQTTSNGWFNFIKFLVLPFGFHPRAMWANFSNYVLSLFWWLSITTILGFGFFIKKYQAKAQALYFLIFIGLTCYLAAYYGSWVFADQLTLQLNKIGLSYVRYFLPLYLLLLPLIAIFLADLGTLFKNKKFSFILNVFFVFSFLFLSINVIYLAGNDNLIKIKKEIVGYNVLNQQVVQLTEKDAVIISERSDKIFFPQRKVIAKWSWPEIAIWIKLLDQGVPLYYYTYEDNTTIDNLNYDLAVDYNIGLADPIQLNKQDRLYRIKKIFYE